MKSAAELLKKSNQIKVIITDLRIGTGHFVDERKNKNRKNIKLGIKFCLKSKTTIGLGVIKTFMMAFFTRTVFT